MLKTVGLILATLASAISTAQGALRLSTSPSSAASQPRCWYTRRSTTTTSTSRVSADPTKKIVCTKSRTSARQCAGIANIRPKQLDAVRWPSTAVKAPKGAISGHDDLLVIPSGYFNRSGLGGTNATAINIVDAKTGNSTAVSASDSDRFYHHVQWLDVDNDGLLDIITAGTMKEIVGEGTSEKHVLYASLYWLKQPASNPFDQSWEQTKVIDGPDVFFSIEDIDGDGNLDLLASQFFSQKLILYINLTWSDPSVGFHAKVIDDTIGPVAHAFTADLNGDGKKEVVVTSRGAKYFAVQSEDENTAIFPLRSAGVFVYELPSFTKHVLTSGYQFSRYIIAPEVPIVVKPTADSKLPVVIMGGGKAYILAPKDNAFNYDLYTIFEDVNMGGVGQICAGDVDVDGKAEIFVPNRKHNTVFVFRFQ